MRTTRHHNENGQQDLFIELKSICVPLLAHSNLEYRSTSKVLALLSDLIARLQYISSEHRELKPALVSYVFFPLSTLLSRNEAANIPDQVLEKVLRVLELIFQWWWWTCEVPVWEQVLMLAGAMLGGISNKGKSRERDDETKEAAARLLLCLLRDRTADLDDGERGARARERLDELQTHAKGEKLVPVVGQTLNTLLLTATSEHRPLQLASLQTIEIILALYVPDAVVPSILPGVVSTTTRVALGHTDKAPKGRGWANGAVVAAALSVLDVVIVRALGDGPCLDAGIVKEFNNLDDLTELISEPASAASTSAVPSESKRYETTRTLVWLRGTSSQLLIALNTLTTLVSHPTASALLALVSLSSSLLTNARLSLPEAHPLLLSFLLLLSNSRFESVSTHSREALSDLLVPPRKGRHVLLQVLLQTTAGNLATLPRLLSTHADSKVEHLAGQVEAVCRLGITDTAAQSQSASTSTIRAGVGKLLGSTGHIEKWGWRLLTVLQFATPSISVATPTALSLEASVPTAVLIVFPEVVLANVASRETHAAIERMLRALGRAGGEECLFAVEWFIGAGSRRGGENAAAALWCACRLLEGVAGVALDENIDLPTTKTRIRGRRVEKFARWLAKTVSEFWNVEEDEDETTEADSEQSYGTRETADVEDERPVIEFVKGLTQLQTRFDVRSSQGRTGSLQSVKARENRVILHKSFSLQLLSISAAILQSRFTTLLVHTLYPLLHSLVSSSAHLSATGFSALQHITHSLGYATPGNLLLSNFDYALDGVSRRLTRRWLDVDATKVLVVLVRLVGRDVVGRAGDVVEECFDRLDDFHGYDIIVEGLVEALLEVVKVAEAEETHLPPSKYNVPPDDYAALPGSRNFENFLHWLDHRFDPPAREEEEDFGPAPREAWGKGKGKELNAEGENAEKRPNESEHFADPKPSPTQALTTQIVSRSLYFLTHGSPSIRARILTLLSASVHVLHESAMLPAVHKAWPFIVNRLGDTETYVVSAAASLVEALAVQHGSFMTARVWDDVWPRFRAMLAQLDDADAESALSRRGTSQRPVGTESAYTHSHRLYCSMLRTMTAAIRGGAQIQDRRAWDVMMAFRRFLHKGAHEELQLCARQLYVALGENNEDAVWLILTSTSMSPGMPHLKHLQQKWEIQESIDAIFKDISNLEQNVIS